MSANEWTNVQEVNKTTDVQRSKFERINKYDLFHFKPEVFFEKSCHAQCLATSVIEKIS